MALVIVTDNGMHLFDCPACEAAHAAWVNTPGPNGAQWTFNGDFDKPTFSPSIRCTYPDGTTCHFFVRNGMIEYCGDCTHHDKSGATISMEDL